MDPGSMGSLLGRACYEGEEEEARRLLALGADPNGEDDDQGYAPLARAAMCGRVGVMAMLAEAGADLDKQEPSGGLTPLMHAAWDVEVGAVRELLRLGANPLAQAADGSVALHYACREGMRAAAEAIMSAGGWSMARDELGRAPIDIAIACAARPGLVASMASRATPSELAQVVAMWDPWRQARLAAQPGVEPSVDPAGAMGAWPPPPPESMERLGEARAALARWEEREELLGASPEGKTERPPRL